MKHLLTLSAAALLLSSCGNTLNRSEYSFELTDNIVSGKLNKVDSNEYSKSCDRDAFIAWELKVKPSDFTGIVYFNATEYWGKYRQENEWPYVALVIGGKMRPMQVTKYVYSGQDDKEKYKEVCAVNDVKQIRLELDPATIVMAPGINPSIPESSKEK